MIDKTYQKEDGTKVSFLLNEELIYCQSLRILLVLVQTIFVHDQIGTDFLRSCTTMIVALRQLSFLSMQV